MEVGEWIGKLNQFVTHPYVIPGLTGDLTLLIKDPRSESGMTNKTRSIVIFGMTIVLGNHYDYSKSFPSTPLSSFNLMPFSLASCLYRSRSFPDSRDGISIFTLTRWSPLAVPPSFCMPYPFILNN